MRYSLLVISQEAQDAQVDEETLAWGRAAFDAHSKSLDAARVLLMTDILQPVAASATVSGSESESRLVGAWRWAAARVRSRIMSRSSSANAAIMAKKNFPSPVGR